MDLNAYVLAMAIVTLARHYRNRHTVSDSELTPLDLRCLKDLHLNSSEPRKIGREGKAHRNVSAALPA
jgi:hypothetical protein